VERGEEIPGCCYDYYRRGRLKKGEDRKWDGKQKNNNKYW